MEIGAGKFAHYRAVRSLKSSFAGAYRMTEADTHLHLLIDKESPFDPGELQLVLQAAGAEGLSALWLMEHRDADHYETLLEALFETGRFGGKLRAPGVWLTPEGIVLRSGCEVSLRGGGDVGVLASPNVLRGLSPEKGAYYLSALLDALDVTNEPYIISAHHLLSPGKDIVGLQGCLGRLSAIELPGKDPGREDTYRQLAAAHQLPMVSGSDSHTWMQVGAGRTAFDAPPDAPIEVLAQCIAAGGARPSVSQHASCMVRLSRMYRSYRRSHHERPRPEAAR